MNKQVLIALGSAATALIAAGIMVNISYHAPKALPRVSTAGVRNSAVRSGHLEPNAKTGPEDTVSSPSAIAAAFGWTLPPKTKPVPVLPQRPTPASSSPIDAPWIRYIGLITGQDGVPYRYFKDNHSGLVIRVSQGLTVDGWTLTIGGTNQAILGHDGEKLKVRITE